MGIIKPPPEIRAVVDKTALFVAKHGKEFEQKIIDKASGTEDPPHRSLTSCAPDPYNAYYEFKIKEFEGAHEAHTAARVSSAGGKKEADEEEADDATDGCDEDGEEQQGKNECIALVLVRIRSSSRSRSQ